MARKDSAAARRTAALMQSAKPDLPAGYYRSGLAELADGKPDAARAALERAAAISPDAIEPLAALVRLNLSEQLSDLALTRIDRVIAQFPKNPLVRNIKGEVLQGLARTDAALASFRDAIALSPSWPIPYRNVAAAESAAGRNDDAIKTLQEGPSGRNGFRRAGG
jgi:tetratricopeptide (TPR) repeat protein